MMGYDWEFDSSVDFAPKHYRMNKYKECEELGKQIKDETSAVAYLTAFQYIEYLSNNHLDEIYNWQILVGYEEMALSTIKSKEAIIKWIEYPSNHKLWKRGFDLLRDTEKKVDEYIRTSTYVTAIFDFNERMERLNKEYAKCPTKKYGTLSHTLYWVKDPMLKRKIREIVLPRVECMEDEDRIYILQMCGVLELYDYRG